MGKQDLAVKDMMAEALRSFLHVTGILAIDDDAEVVKEEQELVAPQKSVDTLFRIVHAERSVVYLFEFLSRWNSRESGKIADRVVTIMPIKAYESLPVGVVVILLTDHDVPRELPEVMLHDREMSGAWTRPIYVKAYELDPRLVLDLGDPRILPMVPLMREDAEAMDRAAGLVAADSKLRAQFVILGSLRYDKDELRKLIGRYNVSLWWAPEILGETPAGKEIIDYYRPQIEAKGREEGMQKGLEKGLEKGLQKGLEKGLQKGLEKGLETGKLQADLRTIRRLLARRFPAMVDSPEIEAITTGGRAEAVLDRLLDAQDEPAARAALSEGAVEG